MSNRVKDYDGMKALIRARMAEIDITHETLEAMGFAKGHVGKILAARQTKNLGPDSFNMFLEYLAIDLVAVVNEERAEKYRPYWAKREKPLPMLSMDSIPRANWLFTPRSGRRARRAYVEKLTPVERSKIARGAARARWKEQRRKRRERADRARLTRLAAANAPADAALPLLEQPSLASLSPVDLASPMVDKLPRNASQRGNLRR